MAIDVNNPSSSDYPTKPTPLVSPPPHREYQHNNNHMIPTPTTKDQAISIPPGISKPDIPTGYSDTSDQYDLNKMTQDAARPKSTWMLLVAANAAIFASIKDTPGFTTSDQDDSETSNQHECNQMTLED